MSSMPALNNLSFFKECQSMASFTDRIPTQVPGLDKFSTINEKLLDPALGIIKTTKRYAETMRSEKKEQNTNKVVLATISRRDTSTNNPIDHEFTDSGSTQRQRVQGNPPHTLSRFAFPKRPPEASKQTTGQSVKGRFLRSSACLCCCHVPLGGHCCPKICSGLRSRPTRSTVTGHNDRNNNAD
jgi:hypothetical protein